MGTGGGEGVGASLPVPCRPQRVRGWAPREGRGSSGPHQGLSLRAFGLSAESDGAVHWSGEPDTQGSAWGTWWGPFLL